MLAEWVQWVYSFLPNASDFGKMPQESYPIAVALCGLGTLMLCKHTGGLGLFSVPLNFIGLFFGMLVSNWLLHGVDLQIDKLIVQPVLVNSLGMTVAGLVIMALVRADTVRSSI